MLVSVIVPAFNVEQWIGHCLASILRQTYQDFELLVFDDGSSDNTLEIAKMLAVSDQRVRVSSHENRGLSWTRNEGVKAAKGEVLVFIDADDWVADNTLEKVVSAFLSSQVDAVFFRGVKAVSERSRFRPGADCVYWGAVTEKGANSANAADIPELFAIYPLAPLKAIKREFYLASGLAFQEGVRYEDNLHHLALLVQNPRVVALPDFLYAWRQSRPGQITGNPHTADCLFIVKEMLVAKPDLPNQAVPYYFISLVRLVAKITTQDLASVSAGDFVGNAWREILSQFDEFELLRIKHEVLSRSKSLHPADLVLALSFLGSSPGFFQLLSPRATLKGRILSFFKILVGVGSFTDTAKVVFCLLKSPRMLINFANGYGEGTVPRF